MHQAEYGLDIRLVHFERKVVTRKFAPECVISIAHVFMSSKVESQETPHFIVLKSPKILGPEYRVAHQGGSQGLFDFGVRFRRCLDVKVGAKLCGNTDRRSILSPSKDADDVLCVNITCLPGEGLKNNHYFFYRVWVVNS